MRVKNTDTNIERICQVIVLDPPTEQVSRIEEQSLLENRRELLILPSHSLCHTGSASSCGEFAYLSTPLAFNLGLHISCFKTLVYYEEDILGSFFKAGSNCENGIEVPVVDMELKPLTKSPRYASHLRASFVKIPECGTLQSLRAVPSVEAEDRQDMIDLALHKYFDVDRYLTRGDIFSVCIKWRCKSAICIPCGQNFLKDEIIYFKVNLLINRETHLHSLD